MVLVFGAVIAGVGFVCFLEQIHIERKATQNKTHGGRS